MKHHRASLPALLLPPKRTRRKPLGFALLLALFAWGCGPAVPEYTPVQSLKGATIKLERKEQVPLSDDSMALMLQYRTDLSIDDDALRAEVEEVWRSFQAEAEAAGLTMGLIEARALNGDRWSRIGRSRRFAFRKNSAGLWDLIESQPARTTAVKAL